MFCSISCRFQLKTKHTALTQCKEQTITRTVKSSKIQNATKHSNKMFINFCWTPQVKIKWKTKENANTLSHIKWDTERMFIFFFILTHENVLIEEEERASVNNNLFGKFMPIVFFLCRWMFKIIFIYSIQQSFSNSLPGTTYINIQTLVRFWF